LKNSEDLKGYKVGIVRGVQHAENATAGVADVTRVTSVEQLFNQLKLISESIGRNWFKAALNKCRQNSNLDC
jgi:hypothetical protein